ncbi:MAG: DUF58 domain-containing protein [Lachnospiraceae bacterium]|nr:DUF58 domain-containing protein [Lachnospiraceae bacterium]
MILLILAFAAILYVAEKYTLKHVLDKVSFETTLNRSVVEPGEAFSWAMTVRNGKRMLVPYLRLRENVPEGLLFADGSEAVGGKWYTWLISTLYLGRYQKVHMSREVKLEKRGRYFFQGASVDAGDFLGIRSVTQSYPELCEVVVKPKRLESLQLTELLGGYFGEHPVPKSLMDDPINIIGFRDYTGREPFRSISWTQSAKYGRLLVKQFEHTTEYSCTVLLNVDGDGIKNRNRDALLETSFSIVRSVCEHLEKKKISYDFRTNGVIAGTMGDWKQIGNGLGAGHLETVLEGLGRMTYVPRERMEHFLEREIRGVQRGRSLVLVTPAEDDYLREAAARLEKMSGRAVLVLCAENFVIADLKDAG